MRLSHAVFLLATLAVCCARAQNSAGGATPGDPVKPVPGTSNDRLLFTVPNFLTLENAGQVPPLTTAEKLRVTARGSFDPTVFVWYGALAGIGQAENSPPSYQQGAAGYARRYAVAFADSTIENFMTKGILPSLLREDPRYFQLGKGGFWHRAGYAVSCVFVTRTDSGNNRFNFSEVAGSAVAAAISVSYHARGERNLPNAMSTWGTQLGFDILWAVGKEFWPDVRRKLNGSKSPEPSNAAASGRPF
jgi:hypothetical protein